jgi:lipopolysaccharide/colanic/teichoic acid biosynthesis glycosyltransferase
MDISKYVNVRRACEKHNVNLKMVSPHIKSLMKKRKIKDVTGVPLVTDHGRTRYLYFQRLFKRMLDLSVLAAGSIVIVPLCLFTACLIKLTSKGPVFFKQKRALYKGGPEIDVYKFRSMCVEADNMKKDLLKENETNGALFKMKNDPRITPVGHLIRKLSLDEFPQFINVLKGEMSIVGPRPLPVNDYNMLKNTDKLCFDWYKKRGQSVVPGITGLWQISGRSELSFEEMCLLDLYYIENQSIFFDLEIMFDTGCVMVFGSGAY